MAQNHPYLIFISIIATLICVTVIFVTWVIYLLVPKENIISNGNIGIVNIEGIIKKSDNIIKALKAFNEAENIKAIIVRIDSPGGSVGPSQEIYNQIRKISENKQIITSMGSIAASGGYYVASGTNCILANPGTLTGSIGVIMTFANVKELMDKIGLDKSIIKSGCYKDIGSSFREMSENEHHILQKLSDDIHDQFISDIAEGRKTDKSEIKKLADGRIFTGRQALEFGLIDKLGSFDDAVEYAAKKTKLKGKPKLVYQKNESQSLKKLIGVYTDILIGKVLNYNIDTKLNLKI